MASPDPPETSPWRVAAAGFIGTAIEYYDFFIFGTAAALVFGKAFFPDLSPTSALLASFATFAVAFIARPLGAVFFGHFGDRLGRKTMLVASLLTMGLATVGVGLLPGYQAIGLWAPALLVLLRLAQGIGLGGEFGGAMIMMTEHAPARRRGFFAALPQLGPPVGLALSSVTFLLITLVMSPAGFEAWGWRVPFLASALLVVVGLYVRLSISESAVFRAVTRRREQARVPLVELLRTQLGRLLLASGPSLLSSMLFFLITTYALSYGTSVLGVSRPLMLVVVIVVVIVNALVTVPLGAASDRIGRRRMVLWGVVGSAVWAVPMFWLVHTRSVVLIALAFSIGIAIYSMIFAPLGAYLPELFTTRTRYTGTSVAFNLGAMCGGALAPTVATQLGAATGNAWWALSGYVVVVSLIALVGVLKLPETHHSSLGPTDSHVGSTAA
ncbi:MFS transporter [Pseudonocardia acaciae]|uniref:MFS transporter n=1 Tax=Pseudonocardia acaciae TaxID=551276 RepID=UPI00048E8159|nr:MFS transporter [Pseudonocardia acaciae]